MQRATVPVGFVVCAAVLVGFVVGLYYLYRGHFGRTLLIPARKRRANLLYRVDHQSLLDACRELSRRVTDGDLEARTYYVHTMPDAAVSSFPQVILDLEPSTVTINEEGVVVVAVAGGLDHFGVIACPKGIDDSLAHGSDGGKKLLDGLWYYDDGYREDPGGYEKKIEALRPRDR